MTKEQCLDYLNDAISLLSEMKDMLDDGEHDAPQAFLEAAHDVQDMVNKAVNEAIIPLLQTKTGYGEELMLSPMGPASMW